MSYLFENSKIGSKVNIVVLLKKLHISWNIHYKCNYRCPYCFQVVEGKFSWPDDEYIPLDIWLDFFNFMYRKYGDLHVELSGSAGEPIIYPNFTELMINLADSYDVDFATSLSCDISFLKDFTSRVNSKNILLTVSFHPYFEDIQVFLKKIKILKEAPFREFKVVYVGYPPQLEMAECYREAILDEGIPFIIIPFRGQYGKKVYPNDYTAEEREFIYRSCDSEQELTQDWVRNQMDFINPKGRLCMAGFRKIHIQKNGNIYRCIELEGAQSLGTIFDKGFRLFAGPTLCENDRCLCETHWII